jgi:hypothetical protein
MQEEWAFQECDDCVIHDIKAFLVPVPTASHGVEAPSETVKQRFKKAQSLLNLKPAFHLSNLRRTAGSGFTRGEDTRLATARRMDDRPRIRSLITGFLAKMDESQ